MIKERKHYNKWYWKFSNLTHTLVHINKLSYHFTILTALGTALFKSPMTFPWSASRNVHPKHQISLLHHSLNNIQFWSHIQSTGRNQKLDRRKYCILHRYLELCRDHLIEGHQALSVPVHFILKLLQVLWLSSWRVFLTNTWLVISKAPPPPQMVSGLPFTGKERGTNFIWSEKQCSDVRDFSFIQPTALIYFPLIGDKLINFRSSWIHRISPVWQRLTTLSTKICPALLALYPLQ